MKVSIDENLCTGCGLCVDVCPEVFEMPEAVSLVKTTDISAEIAEKVKARFQTEVYKSKKIMTEISTASAFYPAEAYHQQYFKKNGFHACVNYLPLPKKN